MDIVNFLLEHGHWAKWKSEKGTEISFDACPNCGKGDEHFNFNIHKNRGGCFSCNYSCDLITLISFLENISREKAREMLFGDSGSELDKIASILSDKEDEVVSEEHVNCELPKEFELIYDVLRKPQVIIPTAFKSRNYDPRILAMYNIGFCRAGDFAARIIFPVITGLKYSFTGRAIQPTQLKKYRHPKGSLTSKLLFGYDKIVRKCDQLFVMEGPTDVLRLTTYNLFGVCTFGKKISSEQIRLITKKEPKEVICLFDGDAFEQNLKAFYKLSVGINTSYVTLPKDSDGEYFDPDDVPKETLLQLIERRVGIDDLTNAIRIFSEL